MRHELTPWRIVPNSSGQLIEGPRWLPDVESFQWVDILGSAIFRWNPYRDERAQRRTLDLDYTTTAEPLDGDRSIIASKCSLHLYRWASDTRELLGTWAFEKDVRFNDSGRSPSGALYFGTMSMAGVSGQGSLYRWTDSHTLEAVLTDVGISNGLAWESDEHAYYVDSMVPGIFTLDSVDKGFERSTLVRFAPEDEPDGLALTPEGTVLVAMWEGGRLIEVSPRGDVIDVIPVPASSPTSVCVGGRRAEYLLVTTARTGSATSDADGAALVCINPDC